MKKVASLILVICCLLLTACNNFSAGTKDGVKGGLVPQNSEGIKKDYDVERLFRENYVDERKLPILDIHIQNPFTDGDRTLVLDDSIENNLELMIYEYYHNLTSGSFEEAKANIADTSLYAATEAYENNFKDGIYYSKILIDEIDLVDKDDLDEITNDNKQAIIKLLDDLNMKEFAIVEVEKTIRHNEKSLGLAPQVGDSDVTRYFVLGKADGNYKIVEVYWEGFMRD